MNIHRMFLVACLTFAGAIGCSAEGVSEPDVEVADARPEIVRYSAEDLAALAPGESLRVNLAATNTVFVVEYLDAAHLDRVIVSEGSGDYVLGDRVAKSQPGADGARSRVLLSGDPDLIEQHAGVPRSATESAAMSEEGERVGETQQALRFCCDECHWDGSILHCTGCSFC